MRPRARPSVGAAVAALSLLGACTDLFHGTDWRKRCGGPTVDGTCGAGGAGGGAASGSGVTTGQGGTGGQDGDAATAACGSLASAHCHASSVCLPLTFGIAWADVAGCVDAVTGSCLRHHFGPGSSFGPSQLTACVEAEGLAQADCAAVLRVLHRQVIPPACDGLGRLGDGSPCVDFRQCAGAACAVPPSEPCGTCATAAPLDAPCAVTADCQPNLTCANGVCVVPRDAGEPCSSSPECFVDLACVEGACTPRQPAGAPCDLGVQDCALEHVCTPNYTCEPLAIAPLGAACGVTAEGGLTLCERGTACEVTDPTVPKGACVEWRTEGQQCNFDGPVSSHCAPPARCVLGVCYVKDASVCG
jgi:hypothetical protein